MGLSIVGALAAKEGILITCRTQPGRGTLMSLLFPGAITSNTQEKK
jgi:signal transduction histidine kinase